MIIYQQSCLKPVAIAQTHFSPRTPSEEIDVALIKAFRRNVSSGPASIGKKSKFTVHPSLQRKQRHPVPKGKRLVTASNSHVVLEQLTYHDIQNIMQDCSTNCLLLNVCQLSGWLNAFSMTL
eukprot:Gregarina_sp_Poly_1__3230@NODE_191_length_11641_cov_669_281061_g170_i0_p13_GENE_NODE_191_length_11641_cov_669_281061_g170_i0NODE_191_length_11641_cov_669_281061_g170_i0_p13_ORF_typecomplete_len122_score15_21_NODE_191_length_11641_cov_669_281061_g170_i016652030